MKTVAIVPMKLNNRRLPQKNTKSFTNGKPLCHYILSTLLTVEGYFKPDEWIDQQGTKHNRIVFIANKFYPALEKEEPGAESTEQPTTKTKKK